MNIFSISVTKRWGEEKTSLGMKICILTEYSQYLVKPGVERILNNNLKIIFPRRTGIKLHGMYVFVWVRI